MRKLGQIIVVCWVGLIAIALLCGYVSSATGAYFSDTETSTNNTLIIASSWGPATETLRPNGVGTNTGLNAFGAAPNYACVDEVTGNSDTDYVYLFNSGDIGLVAFDTYTIQDHSVGSGTITQVTFNIRCRSTGTVNTPWARTVLSTNGTRYYGAQNNLATTYRTYAQQYVNNPKTGLAWTWAEIDALEAGVGMMAISNQESRCTQVWVVVNYMP